MNAAKILGAGFWHQLRYLILPMMKAVILIAADHPRDRGVQDVRRHLPDDAGRAG